jgi:hypothetical protein
MGIFREVETKVFKDKYEEDFDILKQWSDILKQ